MKNNKDLNIEYLILSGGGAAGIAFAGAVTGLQNEPGFSFDQIKEVAGTSMGSIGALLIALGYTADESLKAMYNIDLNKLRGNDSWFRRAINLFNDYGVYKSDALYQILLDLISKKITTKKPEDVTFKDLAEMGFKPLHVVTTKLYMLNGSPTGKRKIFSAEKSPDTSVAAAILASCSAPPYFERVRMIKKAKGKYVLDPDGDLYNDGGVMCNLAIDIFDKAKYVAGCKEEDPNKTVENPHVLALSILSSDRIVDPWHLPEKAKIDDKSPLLYANALYQAVSSKDYLDGFEKPKYHERIVQIDRMGVSLAQFDIDQKTKEMLVASGELSVQRYFQIQRNKAAFDMKKLLQERKAHAFGVKQVPVGMMWQPAEVVAAVKGVKDEQALEKAANFKM